MKRVSNNISGNPIETVNEELTEGTLLGKEGQTEADKNT